MTIEKDFMFIITVCVQQKKKLYENANLEKSAKLKKYISAKGRERENRATNQACWCPAAILAFGERAPSE